MLIIYTDGAARNNPGRAGWGVVIVDTVQSHVVELGGFFPHATNNQMELRGAIEALLYVSQHARFLGEKITLFTDSSYVINGMKKWVYAWQKNGWQTSQKKDVENKKLWEELLKLSLKRDVEWLYVRGHSGVPLNERTDIIATSYADSKHETLYNGAANLYTVSLDPVKPTVESTSLKKKTSKTGYYIVVQNEKISRYETWAQCEDAVKGIKNIKYKKVADKDEEKVFLSKIGM